MDRQVIQHYRRLLKEGFKYAGSIDNPSILLDTVGEEIRICGHVAHNFMYVYLAIVDETITDIKYKCTCDPAANVVVETMCTLLHGCSLVNAAQIGVDDFICEVGSTGEEFLEKAQGMVELLRRGLQRYHSRS